MKGLIIGTGQIGAEYAKILRHMSVEFSVIGRGDASANRFKAQTGIEVITGGAENFFRHNSITYDFVIIAVNVHELSSVIRLAAKHTSAKLLVEKPGGVTGAEIRNLVSDLKDRICDIYIAYNRRYFSSVLKAKKLIEDDGGVSSFFFDFTEWAYKIEALPYPKQVLSHWALANSTHVMDLAFFLGGMPEYLNCEIGGEGKLPWHPSGSIFCGSGKARNGALFSYASNWTAPGRWSVEVLTRRTRYIFKPMEELHVQKTGSVAIEKLAVDDSEFKPGFYGQVEAFLSDPKSSHLCSLTEHIEKLAAYEKIVGYK